MTLTVTESQAGVKRPVTEPVVNDVVIKIATANGTGSQSANLILMRSIFQMGIPTSGKNLFPSNIQGLPTWFTIRANDSGWVACRTHEDFFIAMNPETAEEDISKLRPGSFLILHDALKGFLKRTDLNVAVVPFDTLVADVAKGLLRKKVVNIIYVGVIAFMLDIEMDEVNKAIELQFKSSVKAADLNKAAAKVGFDWAKANLEKQNRFLLRRSTQALGKMVIEGNEAAAIGMMFGGVTVVAWYPITPSSSLCEYLIGYLDKYRKDPETGKATYAVLQAEDELASIAMVVGAGWAGARSFTSTAGPGISLMSEIAGLSYFAEIPAVIVDVQRMGPSTGLPTRTSQGDIMKAYYLSHGDCKHVLLIPGSVAECFEFAAESLNLAEQLQTLVFVMTDLDLGMNYWMSDPFQPITKPISRGKVLSAEDLKKNGSFARYRDVDGDGIGYRTLPGTEHPNAAYFTRGTGHTDRATYSERPEDWKANIDRLSKKFETARKLVPQPIVDKMPGAEVGIIAYGSSDPAIKEARHALNTTDDLKTDYMRVRALPASSAVYDFIRSHRVTYLVEQNRDAQMAAILKDEKPELSTKITSVLHYDGMPIDAESIVNQILSHEEAKGSK